jgi:hypothetical protein
MVADWECIVRKGGAGGDGRDMPGHDEIWSAGRKVLFDYLT